MQIPNQAAIYAAEIERINARIADLSRWAPSARRDAMIEDLRIALDGVLDDAAAAAEIGAELAEAAEEIPAECVIVEAADVQVEEMERVTADLQGRAGWSVRSSRMLILTAFGPQGGTLDAVALQDGRWLIQIAHSDRIATIIIAGGELLDVMIAEMRGVESLGEHVPHDWASAYSADFPY